VQDVDLVDLAFVGKAQAPGQGLLLDLGGQAFAAAFAELFGIRQPLDGCVRIENDRSGDDRARQRPPARFVDSRDQSRRGKGEFDLGRVGVRHRGMIDQGACGVLSCAVEYVRLSRHSAWTGFKA
jgi:hypothetical protein